MHDRDRQFLTRVRWIACGVLVFSLVALVFIPIHQRPSLVGWGLALIRGSGEPHFPIPGTRESRLEDYFSRHPELVPAWREVPDEENGYLRLRKFVDGGAAAALVMTEEIRSMSNQEIPWDQEIIGEFLRENEAEIDSLRTIALMPGRSSKWMAGGEMKVGSAYIQLSGLLEMSCKYHIHAGKLDEALVDFQAMYGLAAHLDGHETATLLDTTLASLSRYAAHRAAHVLLVEAPSDMDLAPWIKVLLDEPFLGDRLASVYLGDGWHWIHFVMDALLDGGQSNAIWDFTAYEDALAARIKAYSVAYANLKGLMDLSAIDEVNREVVAREKRLSKGARELLDAAEGMAWLDGMVRMETEYRLTLAGMQLLHAERDGGPIESVNDPRMDAVVMDPSNGLPFVFDVEARELRAGRGSVIEGHEVLLLGRR